MLLIDLVRNHFSTIYYRPCKPYSGVPAKFRDISTSGNVVLSPSQCADLEDPLRAYGLRVKVEELAFGGADGDVGEAVVCGVLASELECLIMGNEERVVVRCRARPCFLVGAGEDSLVGGRHCEDRSRVWGLE